MGTRGLSGLIIDGTEKIAYQQYDSYPDGVGVDVLAFARTVLDNKESVREAARKLLLVPENEEPTPEQIQQLKDNGFGHLWENVGGDGGSSWYAHLRNAQGHLDQYLAAGAMPQAEGVRDVDDVWLEYSYIVDLDSWHLFAYQGNLYNAPRGKWPLSALPTDKEFIAAFGD